MALERLKTGIKVIAPRKMQLKSSGRKVWLPAGNEGDDAGNKLQLVVVEGRFIEERLG